MLVTVITSLAVLEANAYHTHIELGSVVVTVVPKNHVLPNESLIFGVTELFAYFIKAINKLFCVTLKAEALVEVETTAVLVALEI